MAAIRNSVTDFLRFYRFPLENGTLDFETTIGCAKSILIFIAALTNINLMKLAEPLFLYSTILMWALLFTQLKRERLISG